MSNGVVKSKVEDGAAILVLTRGNSFSEQLTERALNIARSSQSILVAVNVSNEERFSPGAEGERDRRTFRTDCHWNVLAMQKAAALIGVPFDHLILFGSTVDCIEKVHNKYPFLKCVLAEPLDGAAETQLPLESRPSLPKVVIPKQEGEEKGTC